MMIHDRWIPEDTPEDLRAYLDDNPDTFLLLPIDAYIKIWNAAKESK